VERQPPTRRSTGCRDCPWKVANPLFALEEMLVKLVLFGLGGVLLGASESMGEPRNATDRGDDSRHRGSWADSKRCRRLFGSHSPSITDVILGGVGGFARVGNLLSRSRERETECVFDEWSAGGEP